MTCHFRQSCHSKKLQMAVSGSERSFTELRKRALRLFRWPPGSGWQPNASSNPTRLAAGLLTEPGVEPRHRLVEVDVGTRISLPKQLGR